MRNKASTQKKSSQCKEKDNSSSTTKKDSPRSVNAGGDMSDMTKLIIQNLDVEKDKAANIQMDVLEPDAAPAKDVAIAKPQDKPRTKLEPVDNDPPTNEQPQSQRSVEIIIVDDTSDEEDDEPDVADNDAFTDGEENRSDEFVVKDTTQDEGATEELGDDSKDATTVHESKNGGTAIVENSNDDIKMVTPEQKSAEEKKEDSEEMATKETTAASTKGATEKTKENSEIEDKWWAKVFRKNPLMGDIENGGKVVLLLHILAHADMIGEYENSKRIFDLSSVKYVSCISSFSFCA